jgi:hypothetical protein
VVWKETEIDQKRTFGRKKFRLHFFLLKMLRRKVSVDVESAKESRESGGVLRGGKEREIAFVSWLWKRKKRKQSRKALDVGPD